MTVARYISTAVFEAQTWDGLHKTDGSLKLVLVETLR